MRNLILHIICLFTAFFGMAQRPVVSLEVEPKTAEVGEIITITVKSNVQGEIDIDFPPGYVHGYNMMNGMDQEIDYATGKVISFFYLSQTGAISKPGTFKIGPAYIKKGNKVYKSNSVSITILKENASVTNGSDQITNKQWNQSAFGVIEKSKNTIYEGEPLIVNAKVYSRFSPSHMEDYQEYSIDGVLDKHAVTTSSRILVEEETHQRKTYYTFEYDKKVIFPIGTGKFTIEPFKLLLRRGFESMPLTSSAAVFEVKPLPANAPKDFIGAVGQFKISRKISGTQLRQGDVFTLTVEITGTGNLQNIVEPKLNLPKGFRPYGDAVITEDIVYGLKGAEGKVTYEFNVQVTGFGEMKLPANTISYFDPMKEKYVQVISGSDELSIEKNAHFKSIPIDSLNNQMTSSGSPIFPLREEAEYIEIGQPLYKNITFWSGVLSPILLALLLGLFWKKKEEIKQVKQAVYHSKQTVQEIFSNFTEAEKALQEGKTLDFFSWAQKGIHQAFAFTLFNDPGRVISRKEITEELKNVNKSEQEQDLFNSFLDRCENARFGMGTVDSVSEHELNTIKSMLKEYLRG